MSDIKKEEAKNTPIKEEIKKPEVVFPQIGSELRGQYTVYTKDRGAYRWDFPYQSKFEDSVAMLELLKIQIEKTIQDKKIEEARIPENKDKKEEYTPVK